MAGVAAVIVAAGRGTRVGGDLPKQFRPIGGESMLRRALSMFVEHGNVALVQPVIRREDAAPYQSSVAGLDLRPPVFGGATRQASVRAGLEALAAAEPDIVLVHDAALAEWAGLKVSVFAGEPGNVKITDEADFARAEARLAAALGDLRTGTGIDVHAFGPGDHVMLGGIRIAHDRALTGHSDADVALHALTDALLGALAEGDIGVHFPPSDPEWRNAASARFLAFAAERVKARGGRIAHLDLTLVCEAPRIGPHRDAMRATIASLAGIAIERVAVKATTSEKLGFTGRGEGIAAYATATVRLPWSAP
jgi:2-C-methyl-D-erythritol 4-phosphate cytidylyltransferase/2-C-methyl-D-erythritol 2,4-cyclodiphosphate synthase